MTKMGRTKWVFLDRYGWPVERIQGRPFTNLIRLLLHTRGIKRKQAGLSEKNSGEPGMQQNRP